MALLSASDFNGYNDSYAVPAGSSDVMFSGSVDIILSTGITQQVFGTVSTALKCIHYMESNKFYSLSPDEDITILSLRSKLIILENICINQKMMNSYVFTYHGNQVQAIHKSMADMVSLPEALASVGFRCIALPRSTAVNAKLENDRADKGRPRIQMVDYVYKSPTYPTSYESCRFFTYCDFWCLDNQKIIIFFFFDFYSGSNN